MRDRGGHLTRLGLLAVGLGLAVLAAGTLPGDGASGAMAQGLGDAHAGNEGRTVAVTAGARQLRGDARAIHAAGATGVLAAVQGTDGREVTARAGVANLDDGRPVPRGAYYRVGSDTKTFTAVVALQLVGEGAIGLDDTVEQWLPGVVAGNGHDGRRVTVEHLLRQTSGLPDYDHLLFGDPAGFDPEDYREARFEVHTPRELVDLALTQPPEWLPDPGDPAGPGTRWAYSNTNYLLAGMIIEAATGHAWEQEIHERIIVPLGLDHTLTPGTSAYVPQPTATAYTLFPGGEPVDTTLAVGGGPDGAVISTNRDMNTFLRALMGGELLEPHLLAAMKRTVPAEDFSGVPGTGYGMGIAWAPRCGDGEGLWYHGGTSFGTISETGVTGDGSAAATAAVFTVDFADPERQQARDDATRTLIDHALCP